MVQDVTPGSPAERAGLRPYDIILEVEGREVMNNEELIRDISARQPGSVARARSARRPPPDDPGKLAERPLRRPDARRPRGPRTAARARGSRSRPRRRSG